MVTRRLQELRNQLGDDRALQLVKSSFDKPVAIVPEMYRLASDAFRRVATTNYDNFLMTLALRREPDPTIEIYPRVKVEARYFYLHGHAGTAEKIQDVVLCEDEYGYAYDLENGVARSTLWRLLLDGPCIFVGTSLEDPDFLHTIQQTRLFGVAKSSFGVETRSSTTLIQIGFYSRLFRNRQRFETSCSSSQIKTSARKLRADGLTKELARRRTGFYVEASSRYGTYETRVIHV